MSPDLARGANAKSMEILAPSLVVSLLQTQCVRLSLHWILAVKTQNCHLRQIASSTDFNRALELELPKANL